MDTAERLCLFFVKNSEYEDKKDTSYQGRYIEKITASMPSSKKDEVTEVLDEMVDAFIAADDRLTYQENMMEK